MKSIIALLALLLCGTPYISAQSRYESRLPFKQKNGYTVGGIVECDGKPLKNVSVSDGYEITATDSKGAYHLKSDKRNRQIFIITPSGYEPTRTDAVPDFWADLTDASDTFERHDFRLVKTGNKDFGLIVTTDMHFHGKRNDEKTFRGYMQVINREFESLRRDSMPVYSIGLGDISYDQHWYETGVDIERTRQILNENGWQAPFYNIMGNHDSDGAVCAGDSTDFLSAVRYMKTYGPRYYSMNIGNVHFVMLDNIAYYNTPSSSSGYEGINGKRDYKAVFTPEQLDWLEKDLKTVNKKSPLVICMHSPIHSYKNASLEITYGTDRETSQRLEKIVAPFEKVHILSGHTHKNGLTRVKNGNHELICHNLISTCGSIWWNSSFGQPNLGHDGNPVGFDVYRIYGDSVSWRFVTYENNPGEQFKVWDSNSLKRHFATDSEALTLQRHFPKWGNYSHLPENSLLVQVWAWDPEGKLTAMQNGVELPVKCVYEIHPDYYSQTAITKAVWNGDYKKALSKPKRVRMFLVTAADSTSPVEISWKDPFGNLDKRNFFRDSSNP